MLMFSECIYKYNVDENYFMLICVILHSYNYFMLICVIPHSYTAIETALMEISGLKFKTWQFDGKPAF